MTRSWAIARSLYIALMYAFVLGPIAIILFISVNTATTFPSRFQGFTFDWYRSILDRPEFIQAAKASALVALVASIIAVVVALLAGYALVRNKPRGGQAIETALMTPLLIPQIVLSLAMLQFAAMLGIGSGFLGLVAVHAVHIMPFALRLVLTGLARHNFALEEAALSLGASWWKVWWHVTIPLLRPSIVAGFTFCFILSFVNLPVSLFLTNPHTATLPIVMFAYMESRIDPMIASVASVAVIAAALVTLLLEKILRIRLVD